MLQTWRYILNHIDTWMIYGELFRELGQDSRQLIYRGVSIVMGVLPNGWCWFHGQSHWNGWMIWGYPHVWQRHATSIWWYMVLLRSLRQVHFLIFPIRSLCRQEPQGDSPAEQSGHRNIAFGTGKHHHNICWLQCFLILFRKFWEIFRGPHRCFWKWETAKYRISSQAHQMWMYCLWVCGWVQSSFQINNCDYASNDTRVFLRCPRLSALHCASCGPIYQELLSP